MVSRIESFNLEFRSGCWGACGELSGLPPGYLSLSYSTAAPLGLLAEGRVLLEGSSDYHTGKHLKNQQKDVLAG